MDKFWRPEWIEHLLEGRTKWEKRKAGKDEEYNCRKCDKEDDTENLLTAVKEIGK